MKTIYVWLVSPIDCWDFATQLEEERDPRPFGHAWEIQELLNATQSAAEAWGNTAWRGPPYFGVGLVENGTLLWVARKLWDNGNCVVASNDSDWIGKQAYFNHCTITTVRTIDQFDGTP